MSVLRAAARLMLPGYIEAGLSANRIIKSLKSAGMSYRRTDLLTDIREFKGVAQSASRIKNVRKDRIPSENVFASGKTPFNADYAYKVRLSSYDPYTGKMGETWVTMLDDRRHSIADIENKAMEVYGKEFEDEAYNMSDVVNLQSATVYSATRKGI